MPRPDDDLLADLTPAQREAVTHFEGPLLVLAGPGSGKTRVITRRVAHLLRQGVRPGNILAITFTNKAAGEMRQRVDKLVPNSRVWISTFHSFGVRLLRQYAESVDLDRNFTIYDQNDRNRLVKDALAAANIDNIRYTPERIESAISKAKNDLLGPERQDLDPVVREGVLVEPFRLLEIQFAGPDGGACQGDLLQAQHQSGIGQPPRHGSADRLAGRPAGHDPLRSQGC